MEPPLPDERPQRRREYSGAGSTLGVAAMLLIVLGVAIWWFELRGDSGGAKSEAGLGITALPAEANPTGRAASAEPGRAAPNFVLRSPDGTTGSLLDYRGKWVLLNFWASWCGPCRGEAPDLERLQSSSNGGIVVLGVNQQETAGDAREFVEEFALTYPVVMDTTGEVSGAYRVGRGLPISFLVRPDGVIQRVFIGRITSEHVAEITSLSAQGGS